MLSSRLWPNAKIPSCRFTRSNSSLGAKVSLGQWTREVCFSSQPGPTSRITCCCEALVFVLYYSRLFSDEILDCQLELKKMYSEISNFFHNDAECDSHQQQQFLREAARIEMNHPGISNQQDGLISNYKDSKAFKTLLRRQGHVVSRINRIKENFSKKRQ